jgi:hypothetical protein
MSVADAVSASPLIGDASSHAPSIAWLDSSTIIVALIVVLIKIRIRHVRGLAPVGTALCGVDFLNGTVVVPFVVMLGASFDHDLYRTELLPV